MIKLDNSYLDYNNNLCELTEEEINYFEETVVSIKKALSVDIDIYSCNHEREHKGTKHKEALGIFYTSDVEDLKKDCFITVDNLFIHECYEERFFCAYNLNFKSLEEVICHEIAHSEKLRHCKTHSKIADELYEKYLNFKKETMRVQIRSLNEGDIKQVQELDNLSCNGVALMLDCEDYAWGIFKGNELAGYCTIGGADDIEMGYDEYIEWTNNSLLLSDVFVKEEYRRQGLALKLVNEVLDKANPKKESVFITLLDDSLGYLYEKAGFRFIEDGNMVKDSQKKQFADKKMENNNEKNVKEIIIKAMDDMFQKNSFCDYILVQNGQDILLKHSLALDAYMKAYEMSASGNVDCYMAYLGQKAASPVFSVVYGTITLSGQIIYQKPMEKKTDLDKQICEAKACKTEVNKKSHLKEHEIHRK